MQRLIRASAVGLITFSLIGTGSATAASAAEARPMKSDDEEFALLLELSDYYFGGSTKDAVDLAKSVCAKLKAPKTKAGRKKAARGVSQALSLAGWPPGKIGYFVGTATQVYCPAMYNVAVFQ